MNTHTNSFEGNCEEPNVGLKLQKSRINMANGSAIGSEQNGHRLSGDRMRALPGQVGFIPLFIIMFKITQLRNCGISGCTVVEKNVRIQQRFFDNHYKATVKAGF